MMRHNFPLFLLSLAGGLFLVAGFFAILSLPDMAQAHGPVPVAIHYVAPLGTECGSATPCFSSIQTAVDSAAAGDEIRVAAGTYTHVESRPRQDVSATGQVTQVLYLGKSLTIQGGYRTDNWATPDPVANPTILDAQGQGRAAYIAGAISPTLEGLRFTGGSAEGLGGEAGDDENAGGGLYVHLAALTLRGCVIENNVANVSTPYGHGGGAYFYRSGALLEGNTFRANQASTLLGPGYGKGGGVTLYESPATLRDNLFAQNIAGARSTGFGGGLYLNSGDAVIAGNQFTDNIAGAGGFNLYAGERNPKGYGGGLYIVLSRADVRDNVFSGNIASQAYHGYGGGIYTDFSASIFRENHIRGNVASASQAPDAHGIGYGGGVALLRGQDSWQTNTVYGNTASTAGQGYGGGVFADLSASQWMSNTVQENVAATVYSGFGGGFALRQGAPLVTMNRTLSNTASILGEGQGGGLYAERSQVAILGNEFAFNLAARQGQESWTGYGGGIYLLRSEATVEANQIHHNIGQFDYAGQGGGVFLQEDHSTLSRNVIQHNAALRDAAPLTGMGGGIASARGGGRIERNQITDNVGNLSDGAGMGAGIFLFNSAPAIEANRIQGNGGDYETRGGGIYIWNQYTSTLVALTNNFLTGNRAERGGAIYVEGGALQARHNTVADNGSLARDGSLIHGEKNASLVFTNTIVSGNTIPTPGGVQHPSAAILRVDAPAAAALSHTLWEGNSHLVTGGTGAVTNATPLAGNPTFVNPAARDYHLSPLSAAIDRGTDAGVLTDSDGDPRPLGAAPDLGADEATGGTVVRLYLPVVLRN